MDTAAGPVFRSALSSIIPRAEEPNENYVVSYAFLRNVVGILGVALPFVLILGNILIWGGGIADSISAYYHTGMRNWLVGSLCAIGVFFVSYRGPERQDDVLGDIACASAIVVAFFPADEATISWVGVVHWTAAAILFFTLAIFCLALFTKTNYERQRAFYRRCGWTIVACIVLIPLSRFLLRADFSLLGVRPVLLLESIAVLAFGFSWLRKGIGEREGR